jgi:hypothetical protein
MTEPHDTDRATVVPDAAQLHGHPPEGELKPEDVLPIGDASETEHLVDRDGD